MKHPVTVTLRGQTRIRVVGGPPLKEWAESLRIRVPGYQYSPKYKKKLWDGYWSAGACVEIRKDVWQYSVSRGFLKRAIETFDVQNLSNFAIPPGQLEWVRQHTGHLRDYQRRAIAEVLVHRWGKVWLATNAGKGAVMALLASYLATLKKRVLVVCDEVEVFSALKQELLEWGNSPDIGFVEAGSKEIPKQPFVLGMIPTLSRRVEQGWGAWLKTFDACFMDEADKATSASWKNVLSCCVNTEYRVGFSGTFPQENSESLGDRHSSLVLEGLMGPELLNVKNIELIERGISARPSVLIHPFDVEPIVKATGIPKRQWFKLSVAERRDWIFRHTILHNTARHQYIADLIQPDTPTCIIVNRIEHGEILQDFIEGSIFLDGSASKSKRDETLDAFQRGDFRVLIVTKILDRGSNRLGHTMDLILAAGEGSTRQSLQRIGRGLRRAGGKEFLTLHDILDQGHDYLKTGAKKRMLVYQGEGFDVEIVQNK